MHLRGLLCGLDSCADRPLCICGPPPRALCICGPPPRQKKGYISSAVPVRPQHETCLPRVLVLLPTSAARALSSANVPRRARRPPTSPPVMGMRVSPKTTSHPHPRFPLRPRHPRAELAARLVTLPRRRRLSEGRPQTLRPRARRLSEDIPKTLRPRPLRLSEGRPKRLRP